MTNPDGLHDPTPFGYSHTALVPAGSELVIIAGQYASDPNGGVTSADFGEQVQQVFANLGTALAAHDLTPTDVVQLRTYVVGLDFEKLGAFGGAVQALWGENPPPNTMLGVAALAMPDMALEVEAIAARTA